MKKLAKIALLFIVVLLITPVVAFAQDAAPVAEAASSAFDFSGLFGVGVGLTLMGA